MLQPTAASQQQSAVWALFLKVMARVICVVLRHQDVM
jgi:hypothetical protein